MRVVQNLYYCMLSCPSQLTKDLDGLVFLQKSLVQVSWGQSPADRGAHLWLVRGCVSRWLRGDIFSEILFSWKNAEQWASENMENDDGCWNPFFFF